MAAPPRTGFRFPLISALLSLFLIACHSNPEATPAGSQVAMTPPDLAEASGGRALLASGIIMRSYREDSISHQVTTATISIGPRKFGAFRLNRYSELLFEDSHIELFPSHGSEPGSKGEHMGEQNSASKLDFSDTVQEYFEAAYSDMGAIGRLRMENVRITIHGAGNDGGNINVSATMLIKEFADDTEPELYEVSFSDSASKTSLFVPRARWNTTDGRFLIKQT